VQGGGLVGPNLTDEYWINGGDVKNIYQTIKVGVPAKGMIAWQLVFSQKQMQQIASFILTLQGSNPPGGKAPEGELYVRPVAAAKDTVSQKTM
jgi:cytochrome c oxidase cbb3-type subunit 3